MRSFASGITRTIIIIIFFLILISNFSVIIVYHIYGSRTFNYLILLQINRKFMPLILYTYRYNIDMFYRVYVLRARAEREENVTEY